MSIPCYFCRRNLPSFENSNTDPAICDECADNEYKMREFREETKKLVEVASFWDEVEGALFEND